MEGAKGSKDEQGIVSWTIPYFVEEIADIFTVGTEPPYAGLLETGRSWSDISGAGIKVEVTYEGYSGEDPTLEDPVYDFNPNFKEETLIAHPLWPEIKEFYKGIYDEESKQIKFDEFLSSNATGLSAGDRPKKKNPMFGVETFLSLGIAFQKTIVRESVPANLLSEIGTIVESLPGGFPTPAGRDWLVMPPKISQQGSVFRITEELLLSPPGGWPKKVYKLIQI